MEEGNRKQFDVMQKIIENTVQSLASYRAAGQTAGEPFLQKLTEAAKERIKLLKIADSSPHGWGTVSEYEANSITQGEEDDKKLKKAEKAAQEKAALRQQERQAKQARFSPYHQQTNFQPKFRPQRFQYDNQRGDAPSTYRAYSGFRNSNPYRQSTVVPDKPPPKRNVNNDICYGCGSRGHWANACPEKKPDQDPPKECKYFFITSWSYNVSSFSIHHMQ